MRLSPRRPMLAARRFRLPSRPVTTRRKMTVGYYRSPLTSAVRCCLLVAVVAAPASAYIEKVLENDSVCSMRFLSTNIDLVGREEQSALVIRDSRYLQHWTGKHEFNCQFTVTSSLGLGVFAVIQRLSFRRSAKGQCIDYVQFRHTERTISFGEINLKIKSSEPWSDRICGNVNVFEVDIEDSNEINNNNTTTNNNNNNNNNNNKNNNIVGDDDKASINSFVDHRGLIEVKIHLSNKSLDAGEELSFEVVFTAFQECKYDNGFWKSCGSRTCIYKEFFQDGKLNCPYRSCKDESGCHPSVTFKENGDRFNTTFGTKVLAGTIAGLLSMFIAFIAFLWLFRHCGTFLCCMDHPNSHPHSSEMQPVPNLDTMANVIATAPPASMVSSGADVRTANKDLPPSYESLFPSK